MSAPALRRVRWTSKAINRLRFIGNFKAKDNRPAAVAVITRMRYASLVLADQPEMGRVGRIDGTRELMFSDLPYSLAYRVTDEGVDILAVVPTGRQWPLAL